MGLINKRRVLFLAFTLSGFSGLIYESIWSRYLGLFLGHAAYAQSLVLSTFMGGMAFGAWLASRWSPRSHNLLRCYAFVEGIIGLLALLFHEVFTHLVGLLFDSVIPNAGSVTMVAALKWGAASLMILPQSILLGMTFPLMSGGIIRRYPDRPGRVLASLYFCNSIGGVVGVLASGFALIRLVGLPGTVRTAGAINIALAILVWLLARTRESIMEPVPSDGPAARATPPPVELLLVVALFTGTTSFIYEIGWIRMLSMVLGSSTHAFEIMLSAFILGLALGGLWVRSRIDRIRDPVQFLAIVQVTMGLFALSTLALYGQTFDVMQWLLRKLPVSDRGYLLFTLASHGIAVAIMLPATFCAGMTLPLITYVLLRRNFGERSIGIVYSANTVGSIIGVVFAVHIGMPALGLKNLIVAGGAADIVLGLLIFGVLYRSQDWRLSLTALAAGVVGIVCSFGWLELDAYRMASGVFRRTQTPVEFSHGDLVLFHRDGKTATVDMVEGGSQSTFRSIRTNGKIDASLNRDFAGRPTVDEATVILLGALPILLNPGAKSAANIGMGSGLTSHVLLTTNLLREVDTIEIESAMIEGARFFRPRNDLVFTDRRSQIYIEDAKTFFSNHGKRYDIIVSEPSNPWVSGVASLFTGEFYDVISRHLNDGGMLVQWVQVYEIDVPLVASVLKALSPRFTDYQIYAVNGADILIVARKGRSVPRPDATLLTEQVKLAAELKRVGIASIQDIDIRKIGSKRLLDPWVKSVPVSANSDFYPTLDLRADRARFLELNARALHGLRQTSLPVLEMLDGATELDNRTTTITPDRRLRFTMLAFAATLFRNRVIGRADPNPSEGGTEIQLEVHKVFDECVANPHDQEKLKTVFKTAVDVLTYLRPKELEEVLDRFAALPCAASLRDTDLKWIALFHAIGRRDAPAMSRVAEDLLKQDVRYEEIKYLVSVVILANRVQGKSARVRELWLQYRQTNFTPDWLILLDVLAAGSSS